ncbi:S8 family serine peptidase [Owenweeksia hongkongensis]|uniref:S8 family serine peptidase n=1 Tax=Owenweeksia hongkongensis TaxID=253245 RepID=UPI003A8CD7F0
MKRLLLGLSLGITLFCSNSQAQSTAPALYLKNHTIHIQSGTDDLHFTPDEVVDGKIYRIVQESNQKYFKLKMKNESFEVLEYLPHNAFLVSINASSINSFEALLTEKKSRVAKWQAEWKLSPRLFKSDIPDWAWIDNKQIKVWIQTYADINASTAAQLIQNEGLEIIDSKPELNFFAISMKPENAAQIAAFPFVSYLQEMEDPGQIENSTARTDHRVNTLQSSYNGAPNYDGTGVTVGHGDDGALGDHIDYTGRLTQNSPPSTGDHGDHVAGTIFGAGNLDPKGRGMAPGAEIYYQDYPDNLNNVDQDFNTHGVRITSSSYSNGCNAGYTGFTRQMDLDMDDHNTVLHVFSAGNSGTQDCGYGAGSVWGNITGGHKIAKNVVTVANLTRTDVLATSSSRGPSEDGRIKPDISAVGTSVYSTTDLPAPNSYTSKTGTSMSCPGVSGTLATLHEAYRDKVGGDPHSSLLKGIALNTADDLGNPGPDFKFGFGRINARRAYNVIDAQTFISDSSTGTTKSFTINMPSTGTVKEVKIMLIWPDPAASLTAAKVLVNDLDLNASQGSNNYQPLVLNPNPNATTLNANAVEARDSLNNIEQIVISNPSSGNISVDVDAFNLPSNGQKFFIVYEFVMDEVELTYPLGGEGFVPFETEFIRWDASEGTGSFTVEYSTDNGNTWSLINNVSANGSYFFWAVPNIVTNEGKVRVTRGTQVSESPGTFSIIGTPASINFPKQCPDSATIAWTAVPNATGYIVYELGSKYMDSIGYTTTNSLTFGNNNPSVSNWYSVAAVLDSVPGRRAYAVEKPTGLINCNLNFDIEVSQMLSPPSGVTTDCFDYDNTPIKVRLENTGASEVYNFDVSYKINNSAVVTDNITDTIPVGGSLDYSFTSNAGIVGGSNYYISIWVNLAADQNKFNDSISEVVILLPGTTITAPYVQDFESFGPCATTSNCSLGECNLSAGWENAKNIDVDDIDWRVDNGGTPSSGTGPSIDANPGTSTGNYLYLEASGSCDSNEALLLSPCIDLTSANIQSAMASFEYHMSGAQMGKLDVDIISQDELILNVIPTFSGDQGVNWNVANIDLAPYLGEKVVIRLRGKTGDGFRSDLAIDNFSVQASGIGLEESPLGNLALYPNPTTGVFTVSLEENQNGKVSFTVNSITGKQVFTNSADANNQKEFTLNLSHLPKGAYIVTVTTDAGSQNLSMIKQ